eukprot:789925_1
MSSFLKFKRRAQELTKERKSKVLKQIRVFMEEPIQHSSIVEITNGNEDDELVEKVTVPDSVAYSVKVLERYKSDIDIQIASCKSISNLCINPDNIQAVCKIGGVRVILDSLKRHIDNWEVQRSACSALWNISRQSSSRSVLGERAVRRLFRTIVTHPKRELVQEAAIGALANLAPHDKTRKLIGTPAYIKIVFQSMVDHKHDAFVQTAACGLLNNLAYDDELAESIGNLGAIRLIIQSMRAHPDNGKVQRNACAALGNLSSTGVNFTKMVKARGIENLYQAYTSPLETHGLKHLARNALQNMGVTDADRETSSLHVASVNADGDLQVIEKMLLGHNTPMFGSINRRFSWSENFDVNAMDADLNTPLHLAVQASDIVLTEFLVACGANPNLRNKDTLTAEGLAAKYEKVKENPEAAKLVSAIRNGQKERDNLRGVFHLLFLKSLPLCDDISKLIMDFIHPIDIRAVAIQLRKLQKHYVGSRWIFL